MRSAVWQVRKKIRLTGRFALPKVEQLSLIKGDATEINLPKSRSLTTDAQNCRVSAALKTDAE